MRRGLDATERREALWVLGWTSAGSTPKAFVLVCLFHKKAAELTSDFFIMTTIVTRIVDEIVMPRVLPSMVCSGALCYDMPLVCWLVVVTH